jgi:hypothetical protein
MKKLILKPVLAVGALIGTIVLLCTLMPKLPDTYAKKHLVKQQTPVAVELARNDTPMSEEQRIALKEWAAHMKKEEEEAKIRAEWQAVAQSGFDAGYKVGLEIANSLGRNRQITASELGSRAGELQKQFAHAGTETWYEDFGTGLGRALIDKDVTVIIEGSGYSRGGVFYLDNR